MDIIKRLYFDFISFLDQWPQGDPWVLYQKIYLAPHEKFMESYWNHFSHFDLEQIAGRVRQIKREDYHHLRSLVQEQDPGELAEEALKRCQMIFPLDPLPPVYLFVGFFSSDGATLTIEDSPSIALGLERFRDFKDLPLLVSHEYCHCAQQRFMKNLCSSPERTLLQTIWAEGLSVLFTELAYPEIPLHRHLFLTPERLHWCRENQEVLLELVGADLASEKLLPVLFGPGDPQAGLPPRLGYFIARQMLGCCLTHHGAEEFGKTFPGLEDLFRKIIQKKILQPEPGRT